jgi:hypothetical protein
VINPFRTAPRRRPSPPLAVSVRPVAAPSATADTITAAPLAAGGGHVNFTGEPDETRSLPPTARRKYQRLAQIKATYPSNVLHRDANIKPT